MDKKESTRRGIALLISFVLFSSIFGLMLASAARNIDSVTLDGASSVIVEQSDSVTYINASVTVTTTGSGASARWRSTEYLIEGGNWTCLDTQVPGSNGTYTVSFDITAPFNLGTHDVEFRVYQEKNCSGTIPSNPYVSYTLTDGITIITSELCNGLDEDFDGMIDEDSANTANYTLMDFKYTGPTITNHVGICTNGTSICTLNTTDGTSYWNVLAEEVLPIEEIEGEGLNNGLDDDCDGLIDECTPDWTCGEWGVCTPTGQTRECTNSNPRCNQDEPKATKKCNYVPPDADNDGIADAIDTILGNSSNLKGNIELELLVDGVVDNRTASGVANVLFRDSITSKPILEFYYNFTKDTVMNVSSINITTTSKGKGSIIIQGIDLSEQGTKKTAYIGNVDASTNTVCVIDSEVASILVTGDCTDAIKLICDGTNNGDYNCTAVENNTRYRIEGLTHSAVTQYSYTAPAPTTSSGGGGCIPNWTCTEWGDCTSAGTRTRACTNLKSYCPGVKPVLSQSCTYVAPAIVEEIQQPELGSESQQIEQSTPKQTPEITGQATGIAGITGAFIGTPARAIGSSVILFALILGVLLFLLSKKKKKLK